MATANGRLADHLRRAAALLEAQAAEPFRVHAYRRAADRLAGLDAEMARLFAEGGRDALDALPDIGPGIAGAIAEILTRGRWSLLERLEGEVAPEVLLASVPGIGLELARRIHADLGVETLEALALAAQDGRLAQVPGIGDGRAAAIRAAVGERLARLRPRAWRHGAEPTVATLLDVDAAYRAAAAAGRLPRIAPRRFNPAGEAWLPIMHTRRGAWTFTVLFSNTAPAHAAGRVHDRVVLHFDGDGGETGQRTVVTERAGPQAGRRVVRGREADGAAPAGTRRPRDAFPGRQRRSTSAQGGWPVSDDRYRLGESVRREVLGDAHVELADSAKSEIDEAFERFVTESVWGSVWARPDLDRRTRSLLVIALLAQQGQEEELARHLRATRNTGVGVAEMRETILMVAAYAGTPAANRAMRIAKQVHGEEQGTAP